MKKYESVTNNQKKNQLNRFRKVMELTDLCFKTPILNIFKDLEDEPNEERNCKCKKEPNEILELRKNIV